MLALSLVGVLYLVSGLWCLWRPQLASAYLGFELVSPLAFSEFVSVYGGLQCGLAMGFLLSACRPVYREAACFYGWVFSATLAGFRTATVVQITQAPEALFMLVLEWVIALILLFSWWRLKQTQS